MTNNNLTPEQQVWAMAYAAAIQGKYSTTACQDCADWAVTAFRATFPQPEQAPATPAPTTPTRYPWSEAPEWAIYAATDSDGTAYWFGANFGVFVSSKHQPIPGTFPADDWQNSLELNPRLFQAERPPFEPGDIVSDPSHPQSGDFVVLLCGKDKDGGWRFVSDDMNIFNCNRFEKIHNTQTPEQ